MPTGPLTLSSLLSGAKKVVANSHFGEKIVAGLMNTAAGTMKPSPLGLPSRFQGPRAPAAPNPTVDPVAQLLSVPPKATTAKKLAAAREANAAEQFPAVYKNSQTAGGSRPSLEEVKTALKGSLQDVFTLGDVTSKMASPFVYPVARSIKETAAKPFIPSQTTTGGFLTPDYSVPQFNLLTNLKRAGAKVADGIARGASVAYDELVTQPMAAAAQPDMPPSETSYSIMRGGILVDGRPNPDYFDWLKSHGYDPMMGRDQVVRMETFRQQRAAEQARRAMDQGAIADPELQAIATTQEAKSSLPTDTPVTRMNRAAGFEEIPTVSEETQRAGYGEGAGLIAEMLNPLSWIDALDPVGGLLHYRRAAKNVARDASAGRGLVANLPKYEGVGAGKVPFQGMPLSRRHNHADATPATPPSAPADPVRTLLSPGPVPTPHSPILGPLPGAPKTDVVAEHEWLSAAREAVGGGATVPQVAEHLGVTEEEAAHLVARVTPAAAPPGYKGIMQAPRPGASADPVADLLAPITPPTGLAPQGRMLFASPEAKAAGMALAKQAAQAMPAAPVADPVAELLAPSAPLSAPTPAPPAMRAANGAPMQAPPATGPTQDAMPPAAPYAPSAPPPPAVPPVAPVASAAPVESAAIAPQAMPPAAAIPEPTPPVDPPPPPKPVVTPVAPERSRFAPSKPVAPAPRVQEAPPIQASAAPQYAPVDVPGVREPVAPVAPAVGAGTAAPPGVVPPAPQMAPSPVARVERIAQRWDTMSAKDKVRTMATLPPGERAELNALITGEQGRYGDPTARSRNAGGSQVGFLGITPQLVEGAGREVGKAFQSLEKAAEDFAGSVARVAPSGFSPATRRVAQKAKEAVQYWTRKSMLTDNVQDAERLTDLLEGVADSSAGIARRAKDDWAPLRDLPKDVQTEVVAALRDPAKMAALVASNPEVGGMASKARGKITDLTQQVLRQQFGVEEATWAALSTQEKKILDEALRNENTLLPNRQMAVLTDLSRAKLLASGALRPVPGKKGRYEFKDQMLSTSEALDNADGYLQRKYAAFEGGRGVSPEEVIANYPSVAPQAVIAKHPTLTDDEKTRIYELLGNSQSSAGDPRTLRERGMLLARQNISPALRAALGELTGDAGYLVPKTIQDMEKHVALSQTREAIAGNSNWVAPIDETPEAAAARWGVQPTRLSEDVTRNGLLAGRWVHPEVADVLQAQWGFHNPGAAAEAMRGLVGKWKWAKTVANPGSHARQWVQNSVAFDLAAGGWIDGVRRTRDAIGEIAQQGPLYKEARDAGLLRGNFHDAELSRVMHQEALKLEPGPDGMLGHLGSFGELLHTLGGKADRAWQIADEATQVGLFGWAREQGMTAQQAVRYVRDVTYDSSSMSRLERLMSGRGAASTMTKPGTVTKALDALTLVANAPFAMASLYGLRRGAKSLLGIGHNHWMPLTDPALAFRASKYWVLPTLAAGAAGAAVMESRPDYEQPLLDNQLPKTVPLPSQVSAFLGEDGKPNFLDIGAFVPWGEAARAVYDTSKLSGEHDPQSMNPLQHAAAMATGGAMSMVRGGLNPILQTGVDIAQNRDTFSGKPVYNPSMGGREILSKSLGQATRNLLPDFTPGIPAALASGDVRDLIKEGGAGFAKLGAGAYNFAADRYSDATGQAVDHMADYRFRDQSLPRALLSTLLGVRTYDGDAEKNATFRETDRKSAVAEENKNYRRLLRQPQRTDAQRADDEKRHLQRLKNIATGGPQKWRGATPNADTLRGLLGL